MAASKKSDGKSDGKSVLTGFQLFKVKKLPAILKEFPYEPNSTLERLLGDHWDTISDEEKMFEYDYEEPICCRFRNAEGRKICFELVISAVSVELDEQSYCAQHLKLLNSDDADGGDDDDGDGDGDGGDASPETPKSGADKPLA